MGGRSLNHDSTLKSVRLSSSFKVMSSFASGFEELALITLESNKRNTFFMFKICEISAAFTLSDAVAEGRHLSRWRCEPDMIDGYRQPLPLRDVAP